MVALADIHPEKSQQLHTSIRITADGLSFYAKDKESETPIIFSHYPYTETSLSLPLTERVKELLYRNPQLSHPFISTKIFVEPLEVVIIPEELSQGKPLALTKHSLEESDEEKKDILLNISGGSGMAVSFSVSEALYSLGVRSFSNPSYSHIITELIRSSVTLSLETSSKVTCASFTSGCVNIAVAEQGKLLLGNNFIAPQSEDAIYHITRVWRGLGMDALKDHLLLWEENGESSKLYLYFQERIKEYKAFTSPEEIARLYL
ncbi:MAG: DUF3822 family protein [Porphyromonas sp.]|nr:DUF3822 family protein [Porphyromonas sp.]